MNYAHLPAYKRAGFKVVGITDRNASKRRKRRESTGSGKFTPASTNYSVIRKSRSSISPSIPPSRSQIVEKAAAAGKHMLCQKPFADEYAKAVRSVELAEKAKVKIAVNQQMRWDAGIRCARLLIDDGWLGTPIYGTIQVHCKTDWSLWPWI